MKHIKAYIAGLLLVIVFVVLVMALGRDPSAIPSPLISKPFPVLIGKNVMGDHQMIDTSKWAGHPIMVVVFASWCEPCAAELAPMMRYRSKPNAKQLKWVGMVYRDNATAVRTFLKQFGNPFDAVLIDTTSSWEVDLGITGIPETFLIGADGHLLKKHVGVLDDMAWENEILPNLTKVTS